MDVKTRSRMTDEAGVRFGIATGAQIAVLLVAGIFGLGPVGTAVLLVVVAAIVGRSLQPVVVLALGVVAWAFFTGFVENAYGLLTFAAGDLLRLVLIACATCLLARGVARR